MPEVDDSCALPPDAPRLGVGRYRLRFRETNRQRGNGSLTSDSRYLGSSWRGAFGRALRETVCVTGLPDCGGCALVATCPYPTVFENRTPPKAQKLRRYQRIPNPFVLEPAHKGFDDQDGTLNLGVTLMGRGNAHLPYVLPALERAGRNGLTSRRVALELVDVHAESPPKGPEGTRPGWRQVRTPSDEPRNGILHFATPPPPDMVKVRLLSPLRIKRDGRLVGVKAFTFRAFAANLMRRISLLTYFFGETPYETNFADVLARAESVPVRDSQLRWRELRRRSTRQDAEVPMGGLVGSFEVASRSLGLFWPCLWLGQWTHLGKGCTMGLGRYVLETAEQQPEGAASQSGWATPCPL